MDATTTVAIAGLTTTAATALGAPLIQGRIAARNAHAQRLFEQRAAAYADAVAYMQRIEARLDDMVRHPDLRRYRKPIDVEHQDLITARLRLVAPRPILFSWWTLLDTWEALFQNAYEGHDPDDPDDPHLPPDDRDVRNVVAAIKEFDAAVRRAMGV
jgi:hypothetical protein